MQRHLPFEGGVNFRDMGGYEATDGKRVAWRKLFRCGHMAELTETDVAALSALGIRLICDFRTPTENEKRPSRHTPALTAATHAFNIWPKSSRTAAAMIQGLVSGALDDAVIYDGQNAVYREFIADFSDRYAAMFKRILAAEGAPVLIHCAAGKDRTGIGAALILSALGVPEQTIVDDYLLSNACRNLHAYIDGLVDHEVARHGSKARADFDFDRLLLLFGAREDSLRAAFDVMHAKGGSMDGYLCDVLGVTDENRARLRTWFLEA